MSKSIRRIVTILALAASLCGTRAATADVFLTPGAPVRAVPERVLPAEFERQSAVMLGWDEADIAVQQTLVRIIQAAWRNVPVLLLVENAEEEQQAAEALRSVGLPRDAVRFVHLPFDTIWARDYGPTVVRCLDGNSRIVDADYERGERPLDDEVPANLAPLLGLQLVHAPLAIEGGNLLSNGAGLCVTTLKVLDSNIARGYTESQVANLMREHYGAAEVVFLEPLVGETTGHVDMFMTFTSADTVVVGAYAHQDDPVNAEILDRNAERLSNVMTSNGPLKVYRVPMPPHDFETWRTYTNVLYANGVLIVPIYPGVDRDGRATALSIYRRLLPGWKVIGVDCNSLISLGGAVHCVTMNLSRLPQLPAIADRRDPSPAPQLRLEAVRARNARIRMFEPDADAPIKSRWLAAHEDELLRSRNIDGSSSEDHFEMPLQASRREPESSRSSWRQRNAQTDQRRTAAARSLQLDSPPAPASDWKPPRAIPSASAGDSETGEIGVRRLARSQDIFGSVTNPFRAD